MSDTVYMITVEEEAHYKGFFATQLQAAGDAETAALGGGLSPANAARVLAMSGLPREQLSHVYSELAQLNGASSVAEGAFVLAMHIVACVSRRGAPMPPTTPDPLRYLLAAAAPAPPRFYEVEFAAGSLGMRFLKVEGGGGGGGHSHPSFVVEHVSPASQCANLGVVPGDFIAAVAGQLVHGPRCESVTKEMVGDMVRAELSQAGAVKIRFGRLS